MIKRILVSAVVSLGLVLGLAVAPASAAGSEIWIDGTSVTVEPIKPYASSKVVIRVNFGGTAGFRLDETFEPSVTLDSDIGYGFEYFDLEPTSRADIWTATYYLPNDSQVGKWWLGVSAWADWDNGDWDTYDKDFQQSFNVQRPSKLTLNATPEPVDKGDRVKVTGRLQLLRFEYEYSGSGPYWSNLSSQKVKLYFDPAGSDPRRYVTTATTNSSGVYLWTWNASRTGVWSAEYAGTASRTFVVSAGDKVVVG
jgi:hypothetical protein